MVASFIAWVLVAMTGVPQEPVGDRTEAGESAASEDDRSRPIEAQRPAESEPEPTSSGWSLDLAYKHVGLSFGNSKRLVGVRFNARDTGVEKVTGLNLTLWKPGENPDFEMTGLAIGLYGPKVSRMTGVALGLGAVVTNEEQSGLSLAGLAVVSQGPVRGGQIGGLALVAQGSLQGLNVGGLATVTQGNMRGLNVGGVAIVSQGAVEGLNFGGVATVAQSELRGLNLGGLATVSQGNMMGLNVGGVATVSQRDIRGINFGGLATVGQGTVAGINVGGLAAVGQGGMQGLSVAGLAVISSGTMSGIHVAGGVVGSDKRLYLPFGFAADPEDDFGSTRIRGISLATYRTQALEITALNVSGLIMKTNRLIGVSLGAINTVGGQQTGATIGLVNYAEQLDGVQIGVVNFVSENPWPFKVLPLMNLNFHREPREN